MNKKNIKLLETLGAPLLVGILLGAGLMYAALQQNDLSGNFTALAGPIKYNCELSNGTFEDGKCVCPIESFQTQEEMYDKDTGFCQTTFGGYGGNAEAASIGLPYGAYQYWNQIIFGLCQKSGGEISGAACLCPSEKAYNKTTGQCI